MIIQPSSTLRSKKFILTAPFQEIYNLYPDLVQYCMNTKQKKRFNYQRNSCDIIRLELILYYTLQDKQTISYKLVKTQRLLIMLARLSRALKNFIPIQQVLKIQQSSEKNNISKINNQRFKGNEKRGSKILSAQNTYYSEVEYYIQKGQNIFQHYIHHYNGLIALLRQLPSHTQSNNQQQQITFFNPLQLRPLLKKFLHKSIQKIKILQSSIERYQQAVKQLRQDLTETIIKLAQKYESIIYSFVQEVKEVSETDGNVSDFLHGNNKFYKLEVSQLMGETYNFLTEHHSQQVLTVNVEQAAKFLLKVFVKSEQLLLIQNSSKLYQNYHFVKPHSSSNNIESSYSEFKNLNYFDNCQLLIDWNLQDIQKTSVYLQSVYLYSNEKYDKLYSNSKNQGISRDLIVRKFCKQLKNQLILDSYEELSQIFMVEDFVFLQNSLGLKKSLLTGKRKQSKNDSQPNILNHIMSQGFTYQGTTHNEIFQVEYQQMSILNQHIQEHQKEINSNKKQKQEQHQDQTRAITLTRNESMDFLSLFYKYYFTTIHCFISCEKQWYFSNLKVKDHNFSEIYNTMVRWIPLQNKQARKKGKIIQIKASDNGYSSFINYISSLVYTLLEIKNIKCSVNENENSNGQMQEQHNDIHQNNLTNTSTSAKQFIYNDILNCLLYDNLSFQNIQHCHYYLRNCNNDNRHQFEDRSWVQLMSEQSIRLGLKLIFKNKNLWNNNRKGSSLTEIYQEEDLSYQEKEEDSLRLITIPVRGRYCRHLDFFDLSQVYTSIFPSPNSPPHTFNCPKCLIQIEFQQLIYLKQVETLLQWIKMFYLETDKMRINYQLKNELLKNISNDKKKDGQQSSIRVKIKEALKGQQREKEQRDEIHEEYFLKELKLMVDHRNQSIMLKGNYLIVVKDSSSSIVVDQQNFSQSQQIFNHNFSHQTQNTTFHEFQYPLPQEIYQTLLNPNKGFKSNKKLKKILSNFGKSTKISHNQFLHQQNKSYDDFLQSQLTFQEQIKLAHRIVKNRWQLYKDLEKGTIAI